MQDDNANETSIENITLFRLCYFWIIITRSTSTQTTNYPETKLVGGPFNLRKRMKNLPSCVHVFQKNLELGHFTLLFFLQRTANECTKI